MKECQAIATVIFINATLAAACEFSLAHELLNLEQLKAEVLADDARVDLNDATLNFNLMHDKDPGAPVAGKPAC
jgi:hypothetical protein